MTSIHPVRDVPSSSRSLPPLPVEALDRGRAKTRINTDPDAYANLRTPSGTVSVSLPPIRPSARGSKDEGCGPLPGISSIIDQSDLGYEHTRPTRRLSESSPRAYPASPRDWERRVHSPSLWAARQNRVDSISSTDMEGSASRASSPDVSALSSSTSSLSSILEDRSACASPGPIARFAGRLPPLAHSAFELSDLRTSLPSEEATRRSGPSRTPVFRSPRSTPLPLSRPMSPAVQLSPNMRPLSHRLRTLAVGDRAMSKTGSPPSEDEKAASVKSEPETESPPGSPRDLPDLTPLDPEAPSEQRDEQMACTPTQPDPKLDVPWMDTEPSTPTNRHSPLAQSPSTEDGDSKSVIVKQSDSDTEEEGLSYAERRARLRAANSGQIDSTTVRTRGGAGLNWGYPEYPPLPLHPNHEIAQLAQQAERYGLKLQVDHNRQSQLWMEMSERQERIDALQREQEQAAAAFHLASTWNPATDQLGVVPMPEIVPPPLPLSYPPVIAPPPLPPSLSPIPRPSISPIPQPSISPVPQPSMAYMTDFIEPIEYPYAASSGYTDLPPTGLPDPYMTTPGLTAASSATSASSPSDSFYLSSPPPPSLSTQIMPGPSSRATFKASQEFEADLLSPLGGVPTGSGTHKCQACGKTFRRPSGLKDHMNIHSGEKPYCCPLETCRKGFATRSNMIRHHNKTHPTRPKIGGVADINGEPDEPAVEVADPTSTEPGGSSSQGRFRVVQQAGAKEPGVGPMRSTKERRTIRKQAVVGAPSSSV